MIYICDSKLGGVLVETSIKNNTSSYILIGVGINLISSPKILIILQHQFLIINLKLILLMFFLKYQEN